jgi:glyoxylate reductase
MESQNRAELFRDFSTGGRYSDITAIYHEHLSDKRTGHPDAEMMNALPETCKWLAHKGAGYDSIDVHAAKARGM